MIQRRCPPTQRDAASTPDAIRYPPCTQPQPTDNGGCRAHHSGHSTDNQPTNSSEAGTHKGEDGRRWSQSCPRQASPECHNTVAPRLQVRANRMTQQLCTLTHPSSLHLWMPADDPQPQRRRPSRQQQNSTPRWSRPARAVSRGATNSAAAAVVAAS
jgi:hypothetical protein